MHNVKPSFVSGLNTLRELSLCFKTFLHFYKFHLSLDYFSVLMCGRLSWQSVSCYMAYSPAYFKILTHGIIRACGIIQFSDFCRHCFYRAAWNADAVL